MGSIEGRYLRDGSITEIYLPDGLTEIQCDNYTPMELDVPSFANANKVKERKRKWTVLKAIKEVVLILSIIVPYSIVGWKVTDIISDHFALAITFWAVQIWLMIFLFANTREEKE